VSSFGNGRKRTGINTGGTVTDRSIDTNRESSYLCYTSVSCTGSDTLDNVSPISLIGQVTEGDLSPLFDHSFVE
jgi:hypothetical protein